MQQYLASLNILTTKISPNQGACFVTTMIGDRFYVLCNILKGIFFSLTIPFRSFHFFTFFSIFIFSQEQFTIPFFCNNDDNVDDDFFSSIHLLKALEGN